jgi:CRISPR/Cas system-associated protein endoribonuclease Cas2
MRLLLLYELPALYNKETEAAQNFSKVLILSHLIFNSPSSKGMMGN